MGLIILPSAPPNDRVHPYRNGPQPRPTECGWCGTYPCMCKPDRSKHLTKEEYNKIMLKIPVHNKRSLYGNYYGNLIPVKKDNIFKRFYLFIRDL